VKKTGLITAFYEGLLYGANVNSKPFTIRDITYPIEGIYEVWSEVDKQITVPKTIVEAILHYAKKVEDGTKFLNWFREIWVEYSRNQDQEQNALKTFGKRGGEFFMYCLRRVETYDQALPLQNLRQGQAKNEDNESSSLVKNIVIN